MDSTLIVAY